MTEWSGPDPAPPAASPWAPPPRPPTSPRTRRTWLALPAAAAVVLLIMPVVVGVLGLRVLRHEATALTAHKAGAAPRVTLTIRTPPGSGFDLLRDEYAEVAPNVDLDVVEVDDSEELADDLQRDLDRGKGAPDLVLIDETWIGQFDAQADAFFDLRRMPGGAARERDFRPWLWQRPQGRDGRQIALPTYTGGDAFCYRRDLFAKAGLPVDRDEVARMWATWPDFVQVARHYTAVTHQAFLDNASGLYPVVLAQQPVGNFGADGALALHNGPRHAWNTVAPLLEPGISARLDAYDDGWEAGLRSGAFAVAECPSWMLADIADAAPGTFGQWDLTAVPGGSGNWGAAYLAIPAQSRNAAEAWRLLDWFTRSRQEAVRYSTLGAFPATDAGFTDLAVREHVETFFHGAPVGRIYAASVRGVPAQYPDPADPDVTDAVGGELWSVEHGEEKLSEGWGAASEAVGEMLDGQTGTDT